MHGANISLERDPWPVFVGHFIVRFFSKIIESHSFSCQFIPLGTNIPNGNNLCDDSVMITTVLNTNVP